MDDSMLYLFAGFPGKQDSENGQPKGLHAGGLQFCIETVEELGELEHNPFIQYQKGGVFAGLGTEQEWIRDVEQHGHLVSDMLIADGITWDWFPEGFAFGNGVTHSVTTASPVIKTVVHETELSRDEYMDQAPLGTIFHDLPMERKHILTEGWQKYAKRWTAGTCPDVPHKVHIMSILTTHKLPEFAYNRIRAIIEDQALLRDHHRYNVADEPNRYYSAARRYDGKYRLLVSRSAS
jgi:hypothetical protein